MKILKQGKINKNPKQFNCPICDCVFEADVNEYCQFTPTDKQFFVTDCPCCGTRVYKENNYEDY